MLAATEGSLLNVFLARIDLDLWFPIHISKVIRIDWLTAISYMWWMIFIDEFLAEHCRI